MVGKLKITASFQFSSLIFRRFSPQFSRLGLFSWMRVSLSPTFKHPIQNALQKNHMACCRCRGGDYGFGVYERVWNDGINGDR